MQTYQCSPLSTAESIAEAFEAAERYNSAHCIGMVCLDEIGQAEDSPTMPLKVLHAPLEARTVAFIGLSNWAVDLAKLSRGLYLTRDGVDDGDLPQTAGDICRDDRGIVQPLMAPVLPGLSRAFLELYEWLEGRDRGDAAARELRRLMGDGAGPEDEGDDEDGDEGEDEDEEGEGEGEGRLVFGLRPERDLFGMRNFYYLIKQLYHWCTRQAEVRVGGAHVFVVPARDRDLGGACGGHATTCGGAGARAPYVWPCVRVSAWSVRVTVQCVRLIEACTRVTVATRACDYVVVACM